MLIAERIDSFERLGDWLGSALSTVKTDEEGVLGTALVQAERENPWFTQESQMQSLVAIQSWLKKDVLNKWSQHYHLSEPALKKKIAVIMAGNIPMVNFHDFLSVLMTGHQFYGKLSAQDRVLLPVFAGILVKIDYRWSEMISFTEGRMEAFDAVIATGSNNTARYFQYYFSKYPHIIRKNRNSLAVITGEESDQELQALYQDIFQYYGMGCRNVSMVMIPQGYNLPGLFDKWENMPLPTDHYKYKNNYDYYRSIYLVNSQPFLDTGYVSVLRSDSLASPLSVVHYQEYSNFSEVEAFAEKNQSEIQCIVSKAPIKGFLVLPPGDAQQPGIRDYPDGVDIVEFLLAL